MKFYFGSCWICLSGEMWIWIKEYLHKHQEFARYFIHTNCPDESYFQTLVMNSPYKDKVEDYLHYVEWTGTSNPKVLTMSDIGKIKKCGKLMARKFDVDVDKEIVIKLREMNQESEKKK